MKEQDIQAGKIIATEKERILISQFMDLDYPIEIDWNLLMPVVEKIESSGHAVTIQENICLIGTMDEHSATLKTKIESVYAAIISFIQWYNQNKNK